jgi:hypothetical protein
MMKRSTPTIAFVWADPHGRGRNAFAIFRRDFTIAKAPSSAILHLFGDTRYRLRVNGHVVAYGPARFVPSHPEFDSVDIGPWLVKGRNAITVEVNSFGDVDFTSMPSSAGFVAWGSFKDGPRTLDLATPGSWLAYKPLAWDPHAPNWSFAQGPTEILDLRFLPESLFLPGQPGKEWASPVRIEKPHWGKLSPRSVAMFSLDLETPRRLVAQSVIAQDEQIVGCVIPTRRNATGRARCSYCTHVHSPRAQRVTLGLHWGPHFLNGQPIHATRKPGHSNREDYDVELREGWNFLYGEPEMLMTPWAIQIGLPVVAGLTVAAEPSFDCADGMMWREGVEDVTLASARGSSIPTSLETLPVVEGVDWRRQRRTAVPPHAARLMAWTKPESRIVHRPHALDDLTIPAGRPFVLTFDMGREFVGHVVLDVDAPPGTVIDVATHDWLREDNLAYVFNGHWGINCVERYIHSGGRRTIEGFHARGGRYLQLAFRSHDNADVRVHSAKVRRTLQPVRPVGRFACDDPVLGWAYDAGLQTQLCSLEEGWVDPWRERGLYLGDTLVEHHATVVADADTRTVRRCLRLWAQAQRDDGQVPDVVPAWKSDVLHDYSLIYVILLHDVVMHTADLTFLRELWPTVTRVLASPAWTRTKRGLLTAEGLHLFIDWGCDHRTRRGESGVLNAFHVAALERAASLASLLRDRKHATLYAREASLTRKAFSHLWHKPTSRFAGTLLSDESGTTAPHLEGAMHTNALALAYGICTKAQHDGTMAALREALGDEHYLSRFRLELYFHHFVFEALYRVGEYALAERVMRRNWGQMMDDGSITLWETLQAGLAREGSICHGWAAAPTWVLAREVLGVKQTPMKPRSVTIAPASASLTHARGIVAHAEGPIEVEWSVRGSTLDLRAIVPKRVKIHLKPRGMLAKLDLKAHIRAQ